MVFDTILKNHSHSNKNREAHLRGLQEAVFALSVGAVSIVMHSLVS